LKGLEKTFKKPSKNLPKGLVKTFKKPSKPSKNSI
jgi:hypothetical protein